MLLSLVQVSLTWRLEGSCATWQILRAITTLVPEKEAVLVSCYTSPPDPQEARIKVKVKKRGLW